MLHLSMNNFLIISSLFASSDLDNYANVYKLPKASDAIQSEVESKLLHLRLPAQDVKDFQTAYLAREMR